MARKYERSHRLLVPWVYDLGLWIFRLCLELFFREVYPRSAWRVPKKGPVIIVAAPHANQFVDSILLMRILKKHANRRISFLIAGKSMREPYIGTIAGCMGALPVERAMDNVRPAPGKIYLPDPEGDPCLVRGMGTDFTSSQFMISGTIVLPKVGKAAPESETIAEILGPEELRLREPFKSVEEGHCPESLRQGTNFKVAPHINQTEMFQAVFHELAAGGCIGIFPEGGSHDRSDLLPLKAGAAIMALGALAQDPDCGLSVIPCGMNYFHPHKFRSRAVIEFGNPIKVHPDQVEAYKTGGTAKRNAIGSLLQTIYEGLTAVTQLSPDHETLMVVQTIRRLYQPMRKKFPLPFVIELNRRLLHAFTIHKDEPQVVQLTKAVTDYNRRLRTLGIKDRQVEWGNINERPDWLVLGTLIYRICELSLLVIGTLPSLAMFWPVFVTTKVISVKKQRKALAASVVKIRGRDVVGTWKILVAMGLAPLLYTWYTVIMTFWLHYCRHEGYYCSVAPWWLNARIYISDRIPLWIFSIFFFGLMISVTFAGLRIGEIGADVLKSLPPLIIALNPWSAGSLVELREQRQKLSTQVADVIKTFDPAMFPDFESEREVVDPYTDDVYQSQLTDMSLSEPGSRSASVSGASNNRRPTSPGAILHDGSSMPLSASEMKATLREVNRRIGGIFAGENGTVTGDETERGRSARKEEMKDSTTGENGSQENEREEDREAKKTR